MKSPFVRSVTACVARPQSVAAHSLYENSDPYLHRECARTFDLTKSTHEAIDAVTVKIKLEGVNSNQNHTVKLEGAALAESQSIIVGGIRDPYIIPSSDSWIAGWPRCAAISTKAHLTWATRQIRVRTALSFILAVSML